MSEPLDNLEVAEQSAGFLTIFFVFGKLSLLERHYDLARSEGLQGLSRANRVLVEHRSIALLDPDSHEE